MSDSPDVVHATPAKQPQGKKQRTPSAAQGQGKRSSNNNNNRQRRNNPTPANVQGQLDGTVSDTVTNASPRPKNAQGQRHSTAAGAYPQHNSQMGHLNGQKTRPASVGGPMLNGTPVKEQAYAGPTFQASPAASALPVPKFLASRSVPNAAHPTSLQARMEGEKTPEKVASSPEPDVVSPAPPPRESHQSPLDVFFMADKAEKEKRRSGSHNLSPQTAARPPPPMTEPRNHFANPGRSMFLQELDGDDVPSPRTAPPNQRPRLFERATSSPEAVKYSNQSNTQTQHHEASTQALKNLLFNNLNTSPAPQIQPQTSTPPHRGPSNPNTPSPFQHPSTPSRPSDPQQQNNNNYHYGNRNLSPMFKAARAETPPRPSSLRHQNVPSPTAPHPNSANFPCGPSQRALHSNEATANAFSRSYLDQHLRSAVPSGPGTPPALIGHSGGGSAAVPVPMPGAGNGAGASPRNSAGAGGGGGRDLKGMEDDLRRMLRLEGMG